MIARALALLPLLAMHTLGAQLPASGVPDSYTLQSHRGTVTDVAFSPDGGTLAIAGTDGRVSLCTLASRKCAITMRSGEGESYAVAFSRDGHLVAIVGEQAEARVMETVTGALLRRIPLTSYSTAVAFAGGDTLVVGTQDEWLSAFDARKGHLIRRWKVGAPVVVLASAITGSRLATGGPLQLWSEVDSVPMRALRAPGGLTRVAFSDDGRLACSAHIRGVTYLWDLERGAILDSLVSVREVSIASARGTVRDTVRVAMSSMALAGDGRLLVAGDARGVVHMAGTQGDTLNIAFLAHFGSISAMALDRRGTTLVTGSSDGTVKVWDLSFRR
ncbi:MAG: hypothetical protein JWO05_3605 [Gemmatimonadetes bacterium]|nr:hypothetical protein [Gemmatimonadota bacterium]